jgi:hypothetical protein
MAAQDCEKCMQKIAQKDSSFCFDCEFKNPCNWCGKDKGLHKYYCSLCEAACERECKTCHKPYPNLKRFTSDSLRCDSCQKRFLKNKDLRKIQQLKKNITVDNRATMSDWDEVSEGEDEQPTTTSAVKPPSSGRKAYHSSDHQPDRKNLRQQRYSSSVSSDPPLDESDFDEEDAKPAGGSVREKRKYPRKRKLPDESQKRQQTDGDHALAVLRQNADAACAGPPPPPPAAKAPAPPKRGRPSTKKGPPSTTAAEGDDEQPTTAATSTTAPKRAARTKPDPNIQDLRKQKYEQLMTTYWQYCNLYDKQPFFKFDLQF